MRTLLNDLMALRRIMSDPARWTQGAHFRDASGRPAWIVENASCACLSAAPWFVVAETREVGNPQAWHPDKDVGAVRVRNMRAALHTQLPPSYLLLPAFNDDVTTKHEDALALIDAAVIHERHQQNEKIKHDLRNHRKR